VSVPIGHTADLGGTGDLIPLLAQPLDLLVCELAHFEPADLFEVLRNGKIKSLLLTHMSKRWLADRERIAKMARALLPGTSVQFGNDGERIELLPD
jgi:ribonuclease BN (tRNA processing enzyme)